MNLHGVIWNCCHVMPMFMLEGNKQDKHVMSIILHGIQLTSHLHIVHQPKRPALRYLGTVSKPPSWIHEVRMYGHWTFCYFPSQTHTLSKWQGNKPYLEPLCTIQYNCQKKQYIKWHNVMQGSPQQLFYNFSHPPQLLHKSTGVNYIT